MAESARIGVVGGTGAVGTVTLGLLGEHGFDNVRVFASARSAGKVVGGHTIEEARRAADHAGIVANPNCCTIPLTCVLKPLHDAAGLTRVRVATYQSVSGAGAQSMERLRIEP